MKLKNLHRTGGLAAVALTLSLGLAACGGDAETATASGDATSEAPTEETPTEEAPEESTDASAGTFGAACGEVPSEGDGSFQGMATAPVASAASANPLLSTLVAAVGAAELVEPLNSAEELTVFAPANPAFEAFTKKQLNGLLADKETLTAVLTHHVVAGRIAPEDLTGEFETLNGDMITINGSGESATIGDDEQATILCGNVQTANATVYIIDTVQMP